jgi:Domain of unknown function (DUF1772)
MPRALEIAALLLIAIAWAFAFAHAGEYPGKMRLDRETYFKVQAIYYPGFTIGGASEPLASLALAALLAAMPARGSAFLWIAAALAATLATQAVFWLVTQPVNRIWVRDIGLGGAGERFFATGGIAREDDWTKLRDRWEYSHLVRAALMSAALVASIMALTG